MKKLIVVILIVGPLISCSSNKKPEQPIQFSGIYPHLAYYNNEGECGTGAVVPWADRLWVITYGPHLPYGSSDKLYEITPDLEQIVREESLGGTPANRMIHEESNQLFIGPYAIDSERNVRSVSYEDMPGRHTGNARHLTDQSGKIYYGTMEEGFYEVDVNTLEPTLLYQDGNVRKEKGEDVTANQSNALLPGAHGKGLYSGQGVLVYSNNGESGPDALEFFDIPSGSLSEWNGKEWNLVRRNQFVEVTGPGGIYGNNNPESDPIWTTGWDHKSVLIGVRNPEGWDFYRLPKASHSYDGAHGWNSEWPRIRDIGTPEIPDYLMTMHGMFWRFPGTFTGDNSAGIRPRSAYLKVIGDFARWNNQLVFGCDDSAQKEFLNKRKAKGHIEGPGQSNSNLWFTSFDTPDNLGPNTAEGAVWLDENIKACEYSESFLFSGWDTRSAWINNGGESTTSFTFEIDTKGNNKWSVLKTVSVEPGAAVNIPFAENETGEWIRVAADKATLATVHFYYAEKDTRETNPDAMFEGIAIVKEHSSKAGLLYGLGDNRRALGILAGETTNNTFKETGYYELDVEMKLVKKEDIETASFIREKFAIPTNVVTMDDASVLVIDNLGRRWRLPEGNENYSGLTDKGLLRICREVATERDLFNCAGTFYELPAENADGYAKIRPVASHNFRIHDYASYRGLLIITGLQDNIPNGNEHIIRSDDGKAAVWAGVIDDLWKMGKPTGHGGPWKNTAVEANTPSDPYLIGFYDQKELSLSHSSTEAVMFTIEVDPVGHGPWMNWKEVTVKPGEIFTHKFSDSFQSRWIRFKTDKKCEATAWLDYN